MLGSARRHAEKSVLGIDGAKASVGARLDPGDVFADRRDLPSLERRRRDQHGEVRLAAGRWESGCDIALLARRCLDAEDQHVLREPAFVARHHRGDAQREAFLPEKRVAAVARAKGPDLPRLGEMHDPLLFLVAGPGDIRFTRLEWRADRVHARHELALFAEPVDHRATHARHDAHAHGDVRRIGDFDADLRDRRADGPHGERHDIHRASAHAAVEQTLEFAAHFARVDPIVGRSRLLLRPTADEGALFHPRDIARMRTRKE